MYTDSVLNKLFTKIDRTITVTAAVVVVVIVVAVVVLIQYISVLVY
jgi:hypothetical protein